MMGKMNDIKGNNPFRVPEKYFEEVNNKILSSTTGAENESMKKGLYFRLRPFLAVAASVAVLIIISYTATKLFRPVPYSTGILSEISLQEFTDSYLNEIDILTLEQNANPAVISGPVTGLSKLEIIDYLLLENIDENEIFELL